MTCSFIPKDNIPRVESAELKVVYNFNSHFAMLFKILQLELGFNESSDPKAH